MARQNRLSSLAVIAGAALMAVGSMAAPAQASIIYGISSGAIPLNNLIGTGNSLLVGDKIFDNFTYSRTGADMPVASDVNITPEILTVDGRTMWGIQISGAFQDTPTPGASDAILRYNVHVTDPAQFLISGAAILGDPDVIGSGKVQVTETWTPTFGTAKIRVYDIEPGNAVQLKDMITFDTPVASVSVTKDILASIVTGSTGNAAAITSIDQLFSQVDSSGNPRVPEPASLSLLGLGAVGLLARRRR